LTPIADKHRAARCKRNTLASDTRLGIPDERRGERDTERERESEGRGRGRDEASDEADEAREKEREARCERHHRWRHCKNVRARERERERGRGTRGRQRTGRRETRRGRDGVREKDLVVSMAPKRRGVYVVSADVSFLLANKASL